MGRKQGWGVDNIYSQDSAQVASRQPRAYHLDPPPSPLAHLQITTTANAITTTANASNHHEQNYHHHLTLLKLLQILTLLLPSLTPGRSPAQLHTQHHSDSHRPPESPPSSHLFLPYRPCPRQREWSLPALLGLPAAEGGASLQ